MFPELDDLEPLFSDQDEVLPEPARSLIFSPTGTSAPLLSNPALTDTLRNFPLFSSPAGSSNGAEPIEEDEPQRGTDREDQASSQNLETLPTPGRTASGRGRPPGCRRGSTTSSRSLTRANRPTTLSRGRMRTRVRSRTLERAMTSPNIPDSMSPDQQCAGQTSSQAPPYQLRCNRAPRYRCRTCSSLDCSCVNLVEVRAPGKRLVRGAIAHARI